MSTPDTARLAPEVLDRLKKLATTPWVSAVMVDVADLRALIDSTPAPTEGPGDHMTQAEWDEWSNSLASLMEEGEWVALGANPEGAQEGMLTDALTTLTAFWLDLQAIPAVAEHIEEEGRGAVLSFLQDRLASTPAPTEARETFAAGWAAAREHHSECPAWLPDDEGVDEARCGCWKSRPTNMSRTDRQASDEADDLDYAWANYTARTTPASEVAPTNAEAAWQAGWKACAEATKAAVHNAHVAPYRSDWDDRADRIEADA